MLNILRLKFKNRYKNRSINPKYICFKPKDFAPDVSEWKNSIYSYNKSTLSLLPEASKLTIRLIKGYFNLFTLKLKKFRVEKKKKLKYWNPTCSTNRVFVNEGQFKHTNDLVYITIYFYNRQIINYFSRIKFLLKKKKIIIEKIKLIKKKGLKYKKKQTKIQKRINYNILKNNKKMLLYKNFNFRQLKIYNNIYFKWFMKKSLKRVLFYMYYIHLIYLNQSKFNKLYLQDFTNLIRKIYKKDIIFNFINIKYFYLNSNIFTQLLVLKLKNNRRKLWRYIKSILNRPKVTNLKQIKSIINKDKKDKKSLFKYNTLKIFNNKLDITNNLLYDTHLQNKSMNIKKIILNKIKYKTLSGVKLQIGGRLTRRYTASRSIKKIKYKGGLMNMNSSFNGYPSSLLRGKIKSNVQYTKLNSKTRIGSFGIKGWIGGN